MKMNEYERVELQNLKSELRERIAEYKSDLALLNAQSRKAGRFDLNLWADLDDDAEVIRDLSERITLQEASARAVARRNAIDNVTR
jgi:hypothetical protein